MVTLREIAKRHNVDPHSLRVLLRSTGIRAEGRWQWEDDDPFLAKIEELIRKKPRASARPQKATTAMPQAPNVVSTRTMPRHIPSAAKLIERLDRLSASANYDEVVLSFGLESHLIYSWQTHRLRNLEWLMSQGELPIAFIAFKWHGSRLDLRIWHAPWEASEGSLIAAEWVLCSPRPEERTDFEINQDWSPDS